MRLWLLSHVFWACFQPARAPDCRPIDASVYPAALPLIFYPLSIDGFRFVGGAMRQRVSP